MKRRYLIAGLLTLTFGLGAQSVWAASDNPGELTEAELTSIKDNCSVAKNRIQQVRSIDLATRLNKASQVSEMNDLMNRFNSRVVLNGKDSSKVLEASNLLQAKFGKFRDDWNSYNTAVSNLLQFPNCESQPAVFYAALVQVRGIRVQLATDTKAMSDAVNEYRAAVEVLQKQLGGQP